MRGVQRGCLVLADIGGYTRYLAGVELEHSAATEAGRRPGRSGDSARIRAEPERV